MKSPDLENKSITNSVSWVERGLTDTTTHPVEPGIVGGVETKPPTEKPPVAGIETAQTGAGDSIAIGAAGLLAMLLGGLMVLFGRRRSVVE